jgi:hypothetical protein
MFVTVVETGKLWLVQIIQFIAHYLSPQNWSFVYSNIDNLIIAIRGGASLDEAVLATAPQKLTVEKTTWPKNCSTWSITLAKPNPD